MKILICLSILIIAFLNLSFKAAAQNPVPEKTLSIAELKQDFDVFKRALVAIHPGLYRYNTLAETESNFAALEAKLQKPLGEAEFFKLLAQLASKIRCGHTFLNPYNQNKDVRARLFEQQTYFPFYFRLINRRMIVTNNATDQKLSNGSEITKINGVSTDKIINALLIATKADGNNTLSHRLKSIELNREEAARFAFFDWYFPLFFPLKDSVFNMEAIDYASKKKVKFVVFAMTKAERTATMEKRYGAAPTYDDGWKFEILAASTAYLKIGHSITWRLKTIKFKEFLANAFAEMRKQNVENLIIDLRGNSGGDTNVGFELSRYLAKEKLPPYIQTKHLVRNVAPQPELARYLDTYNEQLKFALINGVPESSYKKAENNFLEFVFEGNFPAIIPAENSFKGQAFIIGDASNASATFQFLNYAKQNKLAIIVGQESGGNLQGINGDNYFFLNLPNSKIEIDLPVFYLTPLALQKDGGVIPDKIIEANIDDVAKGVDTELNYVLALIRKDKIE